VSLAAIAVTFVVTVETLNVCSLKIIFTIMPAGDRGSTVVKVLRYKSEGRWFDSKWCHGIFH
jgi:hypothetical protein